MKRSSKQHLMLMAIAMLCIYTADARTGVCYGTLGDNLRPSREIVNLIKRNNIGNIRLYNPNPAILEALQGTNISVIVGVPNEDIQGIVTDPSIATSWVRNNIRKYQYVNFRYISVGNEMNPADNPTSHPTSRQPCNASPIPWPRPGFGESRDGPYQYQNLFHAMVDSVHAALEKAGGPSLKVVVTETGWPTTRGMENTVSNAFAYNSNLFKSVKRGTSRRPRKTLDTYIFSLIDENQKTPELEKHWGIFLPNNVPKYQVSFIA
ncbi:hypothetical protein SASPL_143719 [Salvia splendens]|uniref:Glucan endo-1,3-beta-D-glucosidase n=1 Tax=Salvia splendens TaxID=180675 RepID=A0A8X8WN67_SALSN|nr:hypothetical protein SASPL_143719 [Salvia splendens]